MSTIDILTNNQRDVFQRNVILGVRKVAEQYQQTVKVHALENGTEQPISIPDLGGTVIIANVVPDAFLDSLYRTAKPIALISHQIPKIPVPVVKSNNRQGIAEMVKHLVVDCKRRHLVFIRGLMDQNDAWERETAFRQELIRYDLMVPQSHFVRGDFSAAVAAESVRELLRAGLTFDGIVASDYLMGCAAVQTLRKQGYAVPNDVSVVGYGDGSEAEAAGLSTVAAGVVELGMCAARQLISQMHGRRISGVTTLNVRLVVRDTSHA